MARHADFNEALYATLRGLLAEKVKLCAIFDEWTNTRKEAVLGVNVQYYDRDAAQLVNRPVLLHTFTDSTMQPSEVAGKKENVKGGKKKRVKNSVDADAIRSVVEAWARHFCPDDLAADKNFINEMFISFTHDTASVPKAVRVGSIVVARSVWRDPSITAGPERASPSPNAPPTTHTPT